MVPVPLVPVRPSGRGTAVPAAAAGSPGRARPWPAAGSRTGPAPPGRRPWRARAPGSPGRAGSSGAGSRRRAVRRRAARPGAAAGVAVRGLRGHARGRLLGRQRPGHLRGRRRRDLRRRHRVRRGGRGGLRGRLGRARRGGRVRLLGGLRLVHRDAEVGRQALQPVGVALAERPELPALPAPVQLAADQRRLLARLRLDVEVRQGLAVRVLRVVQQNAQLPYAVEGDAVSRRDEQNPADTGLDTGEVRLDRVGQGLGDALLAEPPHLPGRVPGLVVEDEVLVGAHAAVETEEQRGGVHVRHPLPGRPAQHGAYRGGLERNVRPLQHRVRHAVILPSPSWSRQRGGWLRHHGVT